MSIEHEKEPRPFSLEEIADTIPRELAAELDENLFIDLSAINDEAVKALITLEDTRDFGDEIEAYLEVHPAVELLYSDVDQRSGAYPEQQHEIKMRRAVAVAAMLYDIADWIEICELEALHVPDEQTEAKIIDFKSQKSDAA